MDPFQQGYDDGFIQGQEKGLAQGLIDGRQQGHEQGMQAGYSEGLKAGEASGKADFIDAIDPAQAMQKALEEARNQQLKDNTDSLCELVEQVARRVIHAELTLNPKQILGLVNEAVGRMDSSQGPLKIFLSSEDHQRLAKVGVNHCGAYPLLIDNSLGTGDCRLESKNQQLEVKTEERLETCMEQVRQELEADA